MNKKIAINTKFSTQKQFLPALAFLLFSLLILLSSCDLFTGPKVDLFQVISDEVDWANAAKLTVTVAIPSGWGNSPQFGEGKCGDTRVGYPFNVEFTPDSGYGFQGWLAFNSGDYSQSAVSAMDYEQALSASINGNGVEISNGEVTNTGAYPAVVTVRVNIPVTLVPFCGGRPQIIRSNPPLIPALSAFPFDQKISLEFNMAINRDTAVIGDTIRISAVYRTGTGAGQPAGDDGDVSGFFKMSANPNIEASRIEIVVKDEAPYPASDLQLLNISVEVGPGITNLSGVAMPSVQTITYLTDTSMAQKVYEANNIQASRTDGGGYFQDAGTQWNNPAIDRRFNQTDKNTVYLRFTVNPPEGVTQLPNRFKVMERLSNNLDGISTSGSTTTDYANLAPVSNVYSIAHPLQTTAPGIIQLIILPWYEDAVQADSIEPQDANVARDTGRYVTVVLDTAAPRLLDLGAIITGGSPSVVNNVNTYTFSENAALTLVLNNLTNLRDNGTEGGIPHLEAWNKPWTMDEWQNLQWRVSIGGYNADSSVWFGVQTNSFSSAISSLSLDEATQYDINVYFIDTMGNESSPVSAGVIRQISGSPIPVTDLAAAVNAAGDSVTVTWSTPAGMTGARLYVNNELKTSPVSVQKINADNVRNGQAVSNVQKYEIKIIAYNAAGDAAPVTLSVWNIPGMSVSQTDPAVELVQDNFTTATLNANLSRTLVLTSDVSVSDWTPTGTFTGKFYGNGHTVSISGLTVPATGPANIGLFGEVSGETAVVRDLTVRYSGDVTRSGETHFGGIAGIMSGTARLENTLVLGNFSVKVNTDHDTEVGGFAGRMKDSASILNAYGGLDLTVEHPTCSGKMSNPYEGSSVYIGSIAGIVTGDEIEDNTVKVNIDEVIGVGNINVNNTSACYIEDAGFQGLCVGGLVGLFYDANIEDSQYRQGLINVYINSGSLNLGGVAGVIGRLDYFTDLNFSAKTINCSSVAGSIEIITVSDGAAAIGGFVGQFSLADFDNCYSDNPISVSSDDSYESPVFLGGFVGFVGNSSISYCYSNSDVSLYCPGGNIGGFAGYVFLSDLEYCYASGNVNILTGGGSAGGFIGNYSGRYIKNCYSLGNVFVDSGSTMQAGGLIGVVSGTTIEHNFSMGAVVATSLSTSIYDSINTGCLIGFVDKISLHNNVALGASVKVTSSITTNIGRIAGRLYNNPSLSNNYANGDMTLSTRTANGAAWIPVSLDYLDTLTDPEKAATKDGDSKYEGDFRKPTFWKDLGFSEDDWIFSTTVGMRHPILRARDGSEMGGQR
ncbi:hypothetical protein R84B8_01972 [Treponema sp. R8-4-B8]